MAGLKRKFIAQTGITFDALNLRVEAGAELPAKVPQSDLEDLLKIGAIKAKDESEGDEK